MNEGKAAKKTEKTKYDIAYAKSNIKRVPLDMQKSDYEALKAAAIAKGEKVNEYIKAAIRERMERDKHYNDLGEILPENMQPLDILYSSLSAEDKDGG